MRTTLRYEHDRPATTIDSRRCEWRDQNGKNSRKNWGIPPSCIYRPKSMVDDPQTPWYSCWNHLMYCWGQPCDMSTIGCDSRRCEWREQNSKNFRENWGLPPSCIYRPKSMVDDPQTPWYSCWTHLRYWWGQTCDMRTIDLQQQSIQGDVSEENKTVKIPGRIGGYLHHASIVLNRW
jgi:hypothetical protein